jgi:hypothetical protein
MKLLLAMPLLLQVAPTKMEYARNSRSNHCTVLKGL